MLSVVRFAAVVVLLRFLGVTDTLAEFILAYVLVLLLTGALLYELLTLAAALMTPKLLFLGSTKDRESGGRRSSRRSPKTLLKRPAL